MQTVILPEEFIEQFLVPTRVKTDKRRFLRVLMSWLKAIWVFVGCFLLAYTLINARAIQERASSAWKYDVLNEHQPNQQVKAVVTLPRVGQAEVSVKRVAVAEDNQLIVPRLGVTVPVNWQVGPDEKAVLAALRTGVVQMKTTALPGQSGNVFIVGHSSSAWWDKKQRFPTVFANLARMETGDLIVLHYNQTEYRYSVIDKKVVLPTDLSVMGQSTDSRLSLMTCTPTGTALRRLVVVAEQVEPKPIVAKPSVQPNTSLTLPAVR